MSLTIRQSRVADVGCGHGSSTILMAKAYPDSEFVGFDFHPPSVEWATRAAEKAGVADRTRFEVAPAKSFPRKDYDLVTFFDCLHDMGDPEGAARHVYQSLAQDGTWMIVEPFANDALENNLNPLGRMFYSASTVVCTPASKAQEVGLALGAQAGEARLREVVVRRRLHAVPARHRDAFQHGLGGAAVNFPDFAFVMVRSHVLEMRFARRAAAHERAGTRYQPF